MLAGCGSSGGNARREAVNTYFDRIDQAEAAVISSSGEIDQAFRSFRLTGNSAREVRELEFARDRLATALRRVRALAPPPDARRVHADVVVLLTLQHAAAAELLQVVHYQPAFTRALAPLPAAGKQLAGDIRAAARTKAPPRAAAADSAGIHAWAKGGCAACHTLAVTGAAGTVGPNLDVLRLPAATIAAQVRQGGGGMPAFAKKLKPAEIDAVAAFVASEEAREAASGAALDAYAAAFVRYRDALRGVLAALGRLEAPPVLAPTLRAELRTLGRAAALSGIVGRSLARRDVVAANRAIRQLFAAAAAAGQPSMRTAAAAAVRAYNRRLRRIATISSRIARERQALVARVG